MALDAALKELSEAIIAAHEAFIASLVEPTPEPEPEPVPDPEPTPEPDPEPTPEPEPQPEVEFVSPPLNSDGLAARNGLEWGGHSWGNNSGQTWNREVPYAVGLGTDGKSLRFELHDTPSDHGMKDPDDKRRAEIGSADDFLNGEEYWFAYSFKAEVENLNNDLGQTINQIHWPSGASPALAHRLVHLDGGAGFRVTTRGDGQGNMTRATVPLELGKFHDIVVHFKLGAVGFEKTYLNGELISDFAGPVGTDKEDGYSLRLGCYGAPLNGMKIVYHYKNISEFPKTTDLSERIINPPAL